MTETRLRVDPAEIREQRDRGWPDFHPEDYCHTCGRRNPVWSSPEWVELVGSHAGILCPLCFMELDPDRIWKVTRQDWPGDDQVRQLAGVLRAVANCDEPERVARCVLDTGWVRANEETDTDEQPDLEVWVGIGQRIQDGWEIIPGHRWWRKGEDPEPVTVDQQRVLYPLPKGYVE